MGGVTGWETGRQRCGLVRVICVAEAALTAMYVLVSSVPADLSLANFETELCRLSPHSCLQTTTRHQYKQMKAIFGTWK